jgi:hypothetical protein
MINNDDLNTKNTKQFIEYGKERFGCTKTLKNLQGLK